MGLIDHVRLLLGRGPVPPVLVRARIGKVPVDEVVIEATWQPDALRATYRAKHAQGLCAVPWIASAQAVALVVRAAGRKASLTIAIREARKGTVFEVALDE